MKKRNPAALNIAFGFVLGLFLAVPFSFKLRDKTPPALARNQPPAIPEQLSFAGETVPLQRWDVREKLDRELLINYYDTPTMVYLLKKANRYFPLISERLKAAGVPDDFKYLCIAESNLLGSARSSAGAVGYWQFMSGTASSYGLRVTDEVDERTDIERSTNAACKYLIQAYARFGSWTAAAASYNCGQYRYSSRAQSQCTTNYFDLDLPDETERYVFRVLTFKYLIENAAQFGFALKEQEKYSAIPSRTIIVSTSITSLVDFAHENGTTFQMLRLLNPWLRSQSLTVKAGETYALKLPVS